MDQKYKDKYVLVFPTALLKEIGVFQGLNFDLDKYLGAIEREHKFLRRTDVEEDPNYKQLIPYVIMHHKRRVFRYRRGALLSEKRLLHNYSIGVGGHISVNDPNLFTTSYEEGMRREVNEEVYIDTKYVSNAAALLNDDSNEVGKVHFGVIHVFDLEKPSIRKREKSINETAFVSISEIKHEIERYENWSQICVENIEKLIATAKS